MTSADELFAQSQAFRSIVPLRIPGGWRIAINDLRRGWPDEDDLDLGSTIFHAVNEERRFSVDVEYRRESSVTGFVLTIEYEPWGRDARGRRLRTGTPFRFTAAAETIETMNTPDFETMLGMLEYWIARCTLWTREGS